MISNAWMEQWSVWYGGGGVRKPVIADREGRRGQPLESNKFLVKKTNVSGFCVPMITVNTSEGHLRRKGTLNMYPILKLEQLFQTVKAGLLGKTNDYYQNTDAWRQILRKSANLLFFIQLSLQEWTRPPTLFYFTPVLYTCEGALQERPPLISPIRAAAVGLLELMRTGPLISMEWRWGGGASMGLWDMVREVKECRFLLFFFSPTRWAPLLRGPEEAPSPESPLESDGLSNSISWRAAVLNCQWVKEKQQTEIIGARRALK